MSRNFSFRNPVVLCLIVAFVFSSNSLFAQYFVNGDAEQLSCNCYRLTDDNQDDAGSVWNTNKINLTNPFDFTFQVYLGDDIGEGADGIAFVLQPIDTTVGSSGEGLGYYTVDPSVAIEIDTYQNPAYDPVYDHIGIHVNGDYVDTSPNTIAGPQYALVSGGNIEDGQWHTMRISWDPNTFTLNAYMDGSLRISHVDDIVTNYLLGDPLVYWGFTGSTGFYTNRQEFCLEVSSGLISNVDEICAGDSVVFSDNSFSALGDVESWTWDFDNGTTSDQQNPGAIVFPEPGNYWVVQTIVDAAGCDASDSVEVIVNQTPMADFTFSEVCQDQVTDFQSTTTGNVSNLNWDFGDGSTGIGNTTSNVYAEAGSYTVQLSVGTSDGCADTATSSIVVYENPIAIASDTAMERNITFTADLASGSESEWIILDTSYFNLNPFSYTFPDTGWFDISLVVTNENGCSDTLSYQVYVEQAPFFEATNVFTPNGDEWNELFRPTTFAMTEASMEIFNRWGRPVFKYEGIIPEAEDWGWDGTINGGPKAAAGTYYYILNLKGLDGGNYVDQGTVTLLR